MSRSPEVIQPQEGQDTERNASEPLRPPSRSPFRRERRRVVAAVVLLVGIFGAVGLGLKIRSHAPRQGSIARIGKPLPPLPVADASGVDRDARTLGLGSRTVIVFFSPSCEVCKNELPKLKPFPSELGLIMVSEADSEGHDELESLGLPYGTIFHDRDHVLERASPLPGLPTVFFLDEQGVLRDGLVGAHNQSVVQQKLSQFALTHR